ncbi:hypothetical protein RN001_004329 [Aquatica leii]|uniref:Uncharacterized protein n=1 Tax=Aquatica leii TaxID=1421715 RepID=A0AAN7SRN1_9COLE|nr:hypothetical protein RN001_004329 [Aquatica leii]
MEQFDEDYEPLLTYSRQLLIELERKNQEAYNLKNEVSILLSLKVDCIEELESLRNEAAQKEMESTRQIKHLESSLNSLINDCTEQAQLDNELIADLETEKIDLEHRINRKQREEEEARNVKLKNKSVVKNDQHLLDEINRQIEVMEQQKLDLNINNDLKETLNQKQYNYQCYLEDLEIIKDKIKYCKDEMLVNKSCLDVLKNVPIDPSQQGNSMFAIVKDSFEKLQQKLVKIKKQHSGVEKTFISKLEELNRIQKENEKLCNDLDIVSDGINLDVDEINSLETKIDELNEIVENKYRVFEEAVQIKGNNAPNYAVEFANSCIKSKWAESLKVCKHLQWVFKETFDAAKDLLNKNFELRTSKRKVLQLKTKLEKLDIILSNLKHNLWNLETAQLNDSNEIFESNKENVSEKLQKVNLENEEIDLIQFSSEKLLKSNIEIMEIPKIVVSPSLDNTVSDVQSYEEICKSASAKNYYVLTPISPQNFADTTMDQA